MREFNSFEQEIIHEKMLSSPQSFVEVLSYINEMKKYSKIEYYKTIQSKKKVVSKAIIAAKKGVRKTLAWLIGPIIEQQTNYNTMASNAALSQMIISQRNFQNIKEYTEKFDRFEKDFSRINEEFERKIEDLEFLINALLENNVADIEAARQNRNTSNAKLSHSQAGEDR